MNYPSLKPGVSRVNDPKCLRFALAAVHPRT